MTKRAPLDTQTGEEMEHPDEQKRVRILTCCCCGASTQGRQWWNRDTGFGLCADCADWIPSRWPKLDMVDHYGERGVHYCVDRRPHPTGGLDR